jgi:cytochrome c553
VTRLGKFLRVRKFVGDVCIAARAEVGVAACLMGMAAVLVASFVAVAREVPSAEAAGEKTARQKGVGQKTEGQKAAEQKAEELPAWAYVVNPADFKPPADDGSLRHVPDSAAGWTLTQLRDRFFAPDWHPEDHPKMPEVVAHGRKPDVMACGFCHRADGPGGPENVGIAGLPTAYIVQQMAEFKSGARQSSMPERAPVVFMTSTSKAATDEEVAAAAAYFSSLKPRKTVTVIETETVPKTYVAGWFLAAVNGKDQEPIGMRIIETPKDVERFESRDARSEFLVYVPIGSVAKGEALARTGGDGKTTKCATCHGLELKGLGPIPGIAGRAPSYLVRQLYDFKSGARAGQGSPLMTGVVAKLDAEDVIDLAAYAASLAP